MSSQEAVRVSLMKVTLTSGKETLGTWWFLWQARARLDKTGYTKPQPGTGAKLWANHSEAGRMRTSAWTSWRMGRLMDEMPRLQTGPEKVGRPAL